MLRNELNGQNILITDFFDKKNGQQKKNARCDLFDCRLISIVIIHIENNKVFSINHEQWGCGVTIFYEQCIATW